MNLGSRYLHSEVDEEVDTSSQHRLARLRNLPPPENARDILNILGDTEDKDFPFYRHASATDCYDTLATGKPILCPPASFDSF